MRARPFRAKPLAERVVAALCASALTGCNWISLAANAATYDTLEAGDAGNVVVTDSVAYVTLGDSGLALLDVRSGRRVGTIAPPAGMGSVDDITFADGRLFLLDARPPGHLAVHRSGRPPVPVPVGPFSGISAARGICVVSGGTSKLTLWRYSNDGALALEDSTDLGRGQPDVQVSADGSRAFVSTHYWGPYFGLNVLGVRPGLSGIAKVGIDGAGFTAGGAKPANFPIDVAQLNDSIVLVAHARGVAVVNSHRARVERLIDVGGPAVSVDVKEHEAAIAVAGRAPALVVLAFSGLRERVTRRVSLEPGTKPAGVAFSGDNVFVAARDRGVLVVQR